MCIQVKETAPGKRGLLVKLSTVDGLGFNSARIKKSGLTRLRVPEIRRLVTGNASGHLPTTASALASML